MGALYMKKYDEKGNIEEYFEYLETINQEIEQELYQSNYDSEPKQKTKK